MQLLGWRVAIRPRHGEWPAFQGSGASKVGEASLLRDGLVQSVTIKGARGRREGAGEGWVAPLHVFMHERRRCHDRVVLCLSVLFDRQDGGHEEGARLLGWHSVHHVECGACARHLILDWFDRSLLRLSCCHRLGGSTSAWSNESIEDQVLLNRLEKESTHSAGCGGFVVDDQIYYYKGLGVALMCLSFYLRVIYCEYKNAFSSVSQHLNRI